VSVVALASVPLELMKPIAVGLVCPASIPAAWVIWNPAAPLMSMATGTGNVPAFAAASLTNEAASFGSSTLPFQSGSGRQ
jgi:hypothetical protein